MARQGEGSGVLEGRGNLGQTFAGSAKPPHPAGINRNGSSWGTRRRHPMFRDERRGMITQYAGPSAAGRHLGLEDFETEGVRVVERYYAARDAIFAPGDPDGQLYFLLEGAVRLYRLYGGHKEATVALLKDGGVFGELTLEETPWQNAFAESVTYTRVLTVRKSTLTEVIKRRPEFALKLISS